MHHLTAGDTYHYKSVYSINGCVNDNDQPYSCIKVYVDSTIIQYTDFDPNAYWPSIGLEYAQEARYNETDVPGLSTSPVAFSGMQYETATGTWMAVDSTLLEYRDENPTGRWGHQPVTVDIKIYSLQTRRRWTMRRITRYAAVAGSAAAAAGIAVAAAWHPAAGTTQQQLTAATGTATPTTSTTPTPPPAAAPKIANHGLSFGPPPEAPQGTSWISAATAFSTVTKYGVPADATAADPDPLTKLVTITDRGAYLTTDPATGRPEPTYVDRPAWIIVYRNVPVFLSGPDHRARQTINAPLMFVVDAKTAKLLEVTQASSGILTS